MLLQVGVLSLAVLSIGLADTVNLRDGSKISGQYLGGDSRVVRVAVGDTVNSYPIDQVQSIHFGGNAPDGPPAMSRNDRAPRNDDRPPRNDDRPPRYEETPPPPAQSARERYDPPRHDDNPPPQQYGPTIPANTPIVVRMIDDVDSQRDRTGQTYRANVDEPISVNGEILVPRGADVVVKLVDDKQSGRIEGKTILTLDVMSIQVNGRMVDVSTEDVSRASGSRGAQSAKVVGGVAALGAVIGAIAGGGRGAAIGAVSGAGAGGAVQVLTKGQRVRIPSETRLSFTLDQPVRL